MRLPTGSTVDFTYPFSFICLFLRGRSSTSDSMTLKLNDSLLFLVTVLEGMSLNYLSALRAGVYMLSIVAMLD
jgi:hypothetical protein